MDEAPPPAPSATPVTPPVVPAPVKTTAPAETVRQPPLSPGAATATPRRRRRGIVRLVLLVLGPLLVVTVALWFYVTGARWVGTDNAYVKAARSEISTEVDGRVERILVHENETVKAGQELFSLDPEPFAIALRRAEAQLGMVRMEIEALKVSYRSKQQQVARADADVAFAQREMQRQEELAKTKVASAARVDEAQHAFASSEHAAAGLREDLAEITAQLDGDPEIAPEDHSRYLEAKAARDAAALDLRRATVMAPADGIVTGADDLRPGDYLEAGQVALGLVASDRLWVEANFKETDLTYVRPGQKVTIDIDTYPGASWTGEVQTISPATGSEFSLLPAQNATGNWVKVVQRIPVRIVIQPGSGEQPVLRAGMSAEVEIDTGHEVELPGVVRSALALVRSGSDAEARAEVDAAR